MDLFHDVKKSFDKIVESGDDFSAPIKVHTYVKSADSNRSYNTANTQVQYSIDVDYRSWGIKDISIQLKDFKISVESEEELDDEGRVIDASQSIEVIVYAEKVNIDWTAGKSYHPGDLTITIDEKGVLLSADLEFYYYAPGV